MFKKFKFRSRKRRFIFVVLMSLFALSKVSPAFGVSDAPELQRQWLIDQIKAQPSISNIIVLGPTFNGKSTLINMLFHVSEYATKFKEGDVFLESDNQMTPIYQSEIFRFDINKPVNPRNFAEASIPEDCTSIPGIVSFMPVLGPVAAKDFLKKRSLRSFNSNEKSSSERVAGGTAQVSVYSSHSKVKRPVFHTTLIDAPGIASFQRLAFIKTVIEKSPSEPINALLLVVSAKVLANPDFGPETFAYFKEMSEIIKQLDPTFSRVLLAVTYAGDEAFLAMLPEGDDPRRLVAAKFKEATSMVIASSNIFFFENKYNCLSEAAVEKLYNCHIGETPDPEIELAYQHREKNYKLNVLESFNLLKTAAGINPPLSRSEMLQKIESKLKEKVGSSTGTSQSKTQIDKNIIKKCKEFMTVTENFDEAREFIIRVQSDPDVTEEEIEALNDLDSVITVREELPSLEISLKSISDKLPSVSTKEDLDAIFADLMNFNVKAKTILKYVEEEKLPETEKLLLGNFNASFSKIMSDVIKRFDK